MNCCTNPCFLGARFRIRVIRQRLYTVSQSSSGCDYGVAWHFDLLGTYFSDNRSCCVLARTDWDSRIRSRCVHSGNICHIVRDSFRLCVAATSLGAEQANSLARSLLSRADAVNARLDSTKRLFQLKVLLKRPRKSYPKTRLNSCICSLVPMTVREESSGITWWGSGFGMVAPPVVMATTVHPVRDRIFRCSRLLPITDGLGGYSRTFMSSESRTSRNRVPGGLGATNFTKTWPATTDCDST